MNKKSFKQAYALLNKITLGWNIGNYLDAHNKSFVLDNTNANSIEYIVNLWHNPQFNLKCINSLKDVNINCLRIPVTWCNFLNISNNNFSINKEVFLHLKKIIEYAIKEDFIVILDMHHDDQTWLKVACSKAEFKTICKAYVTIWKLIANEFKYFNQNLIFEGMNEVIDRSNPEKFDWYGDNPIFFKRLNTLYKLFIKTARQFSENNKNRTLMIPTYGAQIHKHSLKNFKLPKDKNIIVDVHYYSKSNNIKLFEETFQPLIDKLIKKNIPVILGEIGAKKDYVKDFTIIETYLNFAKQLNIKCLLWDNGSSRKFINRETGELANINLINYCKSLKQKST